MKAIYKREVRSYFNSMTGWMFVAALTAFTGIYFMARNLFYGDPYFASSLGSTLFVLMVLVPILTMRSMAEERRSREMDEGFDNLMGYTVKLGRGRSTGGEP